MIIYWSMLLCPLVVYFIYSVSCSKENNELYGDILTLNNKSTTISNKVPLFFCILIFGYFTFWIGMRTYIADTSQYILSFNVISSDFDTAWSNINWEGKGPIFEVYKVLFKCFISPEYRWWLMSIAIISSFCVLLVLRKYSVDFFFSSFLFISTGTYFWMMNRMRQFICVAILFLCCNFIKDGKFTYYLIAVVLLSAIHTTALLMIPIYFVARSKPWSLQIVFFIALIILICIFSEPFFAGIDDALQGTNYSSVSQIMQNDDGVNPIRVAFYAIPPILAFWKKDILQENFKENKLLPICINMSLVAAALYFVSMFPSGTIIGRFPIYCEIYNLLLIPYILKYGFDEKDQKIVRLVYTVVLVFYFYLNCPSYYHSDLTNTIY